VTVMRLILPVCVVIVALVVGPSGTAVADPVTTVNGQVPPGTVLALAEVSVMIDTVQADGNRLLVVQGIRRPGTRVAIHVHEYGGHTCVLSGTMTDFVEGEQSMTVPAGSCYYMPPDTPMSAANLGTVDAHLIDTFVLPVGAPPITTLEPDSPSPFPDNVG